ncbi:MAG TPA: aldo/keto reductase, partial [Acidothermaceae bacterium]|nr:aldo/keto reductase [Acidothermaceae bacterium]
MSGRPDEKQAIATIHAALDAGMTFIDTADAYCFTTADFGHGERLVATALASYGGDTTEILVATKGGHTRGT